MTHELSEYVVNVKAAKLRKLGYKNLQEWLKNPDHVYIGRDMSFYVPGAEGSIWKNPFSVKKYGRDGCLQKYREYLLESPELLAKLPDLKGKVLGCWCHPADCHGHILAQLANQDSDDE